MRFINKRGASIIEYCIILAFICILGFFLLGSSISGSVDSIIGSASEMLSMQNIDKNSKPNANATIPGALENVKTSIGYWDFWSPKPGLKTKDTTTGNIEQYTLALTYGDGGLYNLEPNTEYVLKLNTAGLNEEQIALIKNIATVSFANQEGTVNYDITSGSNLGRGYRDYKALSTDGITFTTGANACYMGFNVNKRATATDNIADDKYKYTAEQAAEAKNLLSTRLTLVKKNV